MFIVLYNVLINLNVSVIQYMAYVFKNSLKYGDRGRLFAFFVCLFYALAPCGDTLGS